MAFNPYLFYSGNACRAAFTQYHDIFGGELVLLRAGDVPSDGNSPDLDPDMIIHAALEVGGSWLMASDDPSGTGGPVEGITVNYSTTDAADAKRVFDALADGGSVTQPLTETFFSPSFGMCVDRFGIPWMVVAQPAEQPA